MIDFTNGTIVKLGPSQPDPDVIAMLVQGEQVFRSFKGMRDSVHFTSKRIIAVNVQGITGKKTDYSSLPYSKIQAWSVETAGRFDRDCELEIWFSGLGKVRLEFAGSVDVKVLGQIIRPFCTAYRASNSCPATRTKPGL